MGLNSYQVTFESCGDHCQIYERDIQDVMAALPVEPACMGKAVGEAGRPPMFVGLAE